MKFMSGEHKLISCYRRYIICNLIVWKNIKIFILFKGFFKYLYLDYLCLSSHSKNQENKLMDSLPKYSQLFLTFQTFVPWAIWQTIGFKQGVCSSAKFSFRNADKLSRQTLLHWFPGLREALCCCSLVWCRAPGCARRPYRDVGKVRRSWQV